MKNRQTNTYTLRSWISALIVGVAIIVIGYFLYIEYITPAPLIPSQPMTKAADASGAQKTDEQKDQYNVPPTHPRELIIKKLGINANILPVSTLKDGSIDAPKTAWDAGWYEESALPGTGKGALFIDGHVNDALGTPGIFYKLDSLAAGDIITVERGDHVAINYTVQTVDQRPIAGVDTSQALRSFVPGKEGLNLMTCGGVYDAARKTYDDRVIVYAVAT